MEVLPEDSFYRRSIYGRSGDDPRIQRTSACRKRAGEFKFKLGLICGWPTRECSAQRRDRQGNEPTRRHSTLPQQSAQSQ